MIIRDKDGERGDGERGRKARVEDHTAEGAAPREQEKKGGTAAEFEEENRGARMREESTNRRRWVNIAVHRDEGEPRYR